MAIDDLGKVSGESRCKIDVTGDGHVAFDHGSILLTWDEPMQRWIESRRTDSLETLCRRFSRMGSNVVVFAAFGVLVVVSG
ncbi:hypothetical protein [Ilumatobacter sp.]|uniref:hypothetical protein n=1 Tax=Ilumatobacter sp. TaxID=1967498 RepID=UPI003751D5CA